MPLAPKPFALPTRPEGRRLAELFGFDLPSRKRREQAKALLVAQKPRRGSRGVR